MEDGLRTGSALTAGNYTHGCILKEGLTMSEIYSDINHKNSLPQLFSDFLDIVDHLERRLDAIELELSRDISLEDTVKLLLLRGEPVFYACREYEERTITRYEGFIIKGPVTETSRRFREFKIFSKGFSRRRTHGIR